MEPIFTDSEIFLKFINTVQRLIDDKTNKNRVNIKAIPKILNAV